MRRDHAEHNEALCDHLISVGNYNDWVITTAFYSAMHFIQSKIFPLKIGQVEFFNLNHYYSFNRSKHRGRHGAMIDLTWQNLPAIAGEYEWLHDVCRNARYKDYQVEEPQATQARKFLSAIKNCC